MGPTQAGLVTLDMWPLQALQCTAGERHRWQPGRQAWKLRMWWLMQTGPAWSWRQVSIRGGAMATTGDQQRTQQMHEHGKLPRWRQGMVHLCIDSDMYSRRSAKLTFCNGGQRLLQCIYLC